MSEFVKRAKEIAGNNFKKGYNCAEAVLATFSELAPEVVDKKMIKLSSTLGGGLGKAEALCGALNAAELVLGAYIGRTSPEEKSLTEIYPLSKELHDVFVEKFGSDSCKVLKPYPFGSKEHLHTCIKISGNTAEALAQFLVDKNIVSD